MNVDSRIQTIRIGPHEVAYSALGDGPPLVCSELPLNPFVFFGGLQRQLAGKHRVYILDFRPAVGGSGRRPPADSLLEFVAELSLEALGRLGIASCGLAGSFMYGSVAIEMAIRSPKAVKFLILVSALGVAALPRTPLMRAVTSFYKLPLLPLVMRWTPFRALVEWSDYYLISPRRKREMFYRPEAVGVPMEEMYEQYKRPRNAAAALALMWAIRNMGCDRVAPRLGEVTCPTLILHGQENRWIPVRLAEQMQTRIPNSQLVTFPQVRHAPTLEEPDKAFQCIEQFVAKAGGPL